jgi:hypothetical protein
MAAQFDPYHTWLGIPPEDQPADHYRLLGVKRFETDANVIDNAADRQMSHLRSVRTGKHAEAAERLLNEVARARVCLLDEEARADYNRQLRAAADVPLPQAKPLEAPPKIVTAGRPTTRSSPVMLLLAAGGIVACLLGLTVIAAAAWYFYASPTELVVEGDVPPVKVVEEGAAPVAAPPTAETVDQQDAPAEVVPTAPPQETADGAEPPPQAVDSTAAPGAIDNSPPTISDAPSDTATAGDDTPVLPPGTIAVCGVLETKRDPKEVAPGAIPFETSAGDGRSGSNGVLLASPAGWERSGTCWTCDPYQFSGSAQGISFIHPLGPGHVVARIFRGLNLTSSADWRRGRKLPIETTSDYAALTDKAGLPPCHLESRLTADGNYSLWMNGKLLATAKIDQVEPLTFSEDFTGAEGFQRQLSPGQAGVLLAPMDSGVNRAENVTLAVLPESAGGEPAVVVAGKTNAVPGQRASAPGGKPEQVASVDRPAGDEPTSKPPTSDTGDSDTGDSDTGDSDTGDSDTGDSDTGDSDTGDSDTGDSDTGDSDTGDSDTGDSASGGASSGRASGGPAAAAGGDKEEAKSDWRPPTKNSKALFRSFLGRYRNGMKKTLFYPVVNLNVPNKDLWTEDIQNKLRGKIPFAEIGYLGAAKIVIPEDGVYVLELSNKGCRVAINGRDTGGGGEVQLRKGIHAVTLSVGTHGQPYLHSAAISLKHKDTGEEVPFVNSWQDILQFTNRRVAGLPVLEVSGWEPSEDNQVDITLPRR